MLSVILSHTKGHYAECRVLYCRADFLSCEAECHYAECHYVECCEAQSW
jgi:hypothetical protein